MDWEDRVDHIRLCTVRTKLSRICGVYDRGESISRRRYKHSINIVDGQEHCFIGVRAIDLDGGDPSNHAG